MDFAGISYVIWKASGGAADSPTASGWTPDSSAAKAPAIAAVRRQGLAMLVIGAETGKPVRSLSGSAGPPLPPDHVQRVRNRDVHRKAGGGGEQRVRRRDGPHRHVPRRNPANGRQGQHGAAVRRHRAPGLELHTARFVHTASKARSFPALRESHPPGPVDPGPDPRKGQAWLHVEEPGLLCL